MFIEVGELRVAPRRCAMSCGLGEPTVLRMQITKLMRVICRDPSAHRTPNGVRGGRDPDPINISLLWSEERPAN